MKKSVGEDGETYVVDALFSFVATLSMKSEKASDETAYNFAEK